jgi:hypothetical protein
MKIGELDGMGWNEFHHIPFHSIHILQIQTMEPNYLPLHSIPSFTTNPNIALVYPSLNDPASAFQLSSTNFNKPYTSTASSSAVHCRFVLFIL